MGELKMQRWEPEAFILHGDAQYNMMPSDNGDFVLNDVAKAEIEKLTQQNQELIDMLNQSRDFIAEDVNCGPQGVGLICMIDDLLTKIKGES